MPIEIDTDRGPKKGVTDGWCGVLSTEKTVEKKPVEKTPEPQQPEPDKDQSSTS